MTHQGHELSSGELKNILIILVTVICFDQFVFWQSIT